MLKLILMFILITNIILLIIIFTDNYDNFDNDVVTGQLNCW